MSSGLPSCVLATAENHPTVSPELLLTKLPGAAYRRLHDHEWTMEFASAGIERLTGYSPEALTLPPRISFASLVHRDDQAAVRDAIAQAVEAHSSFQVRYRIHCADGNTKWISEQGVVLPRGDDPVVALEGFMTDITWTCTAELSLQEQASLLERARDAIVVMTMDSTIIFWNKGAERLYGWAAADALGKPFRDLICGHLPSHDAAYKAVLDDGEWVGELAHRRHDGSEVEVQTSWTLLEPVHALGVSRKILVIGADISERKHNEAQIQRMAFFDVLTGLPNRAHFLDHLQQALIGSARTGRYGALLFCDLDNFKLVNDSQGHAAGDMLLQAIAQRLKRCVREADMVARLGGDEFVVLLQPAEETSAAAAAQAEAVAAKIDSAMSTPVDIIDLSFRVSASVGVTTLCGRSSTVESALSEADAAMYQAKACGRSTFRFHDPVIQAQWAARAELEKDLWRALTSHEFMLYYQPQLDLQNRVIGAEALLRWRLPNGKLVYPNEFVKVAEESSLIVEIGEWVLRTACSQLAAWQRAPNTAHISLSVNVSARQFNDPAFVSTLQAIFEDTGVDPSGLKLELTENLLVRDFVKTADIMEWLKQRGVCISLDDFGTGYSSLAYLRKLPVDQLKIDHSFMRDVLTDPGDASIVRSIIALAVNLGLEVIAEGVETIGQRNFLSGAGCAFFQGFLYKNAISAENFAQYVRDVH
jgi:diguanylate cyclase (GGDEF)-like protein/PAS domain S-box-containing protein